MLLPHPGPHTFFSLILYLCQINVMSPYDIIIYFMAVSQLYFYSPTEWRKHLHKDELFIPDRLIGTFLYGGPTLKLEEHKEDYYSEDKLPPKKQNDKIFEK